MSPKNRNDAIRAGARQAAGQLKAAAERAEPLAKNTGEAARRQILKTRAWVAAHVKRSGQVLQDTVAPKLSAMLASAAKRIDPAQARHRQWKKPVGLATLTAAGGAVAAFLRGRNKSGPATSGQADTIKPTGNGQAKTSTDSERGMKSQARS